MHWFGNAPFWSAIVAESTFTSSTVADEGMRREGLADLQQIEAVMHAPYIEGVVSSWDAMP